MFGGGERYPLELARAMAERVECELVTFGPEPSATRDARLRIRVLRPVGYVGGHPARPIVPALPGVLRRAHVVHAHHVRSPSSVLAAVTARMRGVPAVVTDHGLQGPDWGGVVRALFDRFLSVSAYSARETGAPAAKVRLIYGGADPNRYRPDPSARRDGVLFVGRITPHKGIDVLLRALPAGASLTIAGSGGHDPMPPEREYPDLLRRLARGRRVEFLDAVDDGELARLYRSAEVLVLPSVNRTCYGRSVAVSELLGLVLLEAMASGTPVIASRIGGVPEIVDDGRTGYLVTPGDHRELRGRIAELLGDRARAEAMGTAARQRVLSDFTWERCVDRCLAAYAELAASRRATRQRPRRR